MSQEIEKPEAAVAAQPGTLSAFFAAQKGALPTEDVLHVMLPLMRSVAALHVKGLVAALGLHGVVETGDGAFALVRSEGQTPKANQPALRRIQPQSNSGLKIVGEYRVTNDEAAGKKVEDLSAEASDELHITKPVYLTDLRCWEHEVDHHDEITDVFQVVMIMACIACGLDPRDADDIERFSFNRSNLFAIQPRLHPVLASIILEATALNRHERATDLAALAKRLETYRDQPIGLEVDRVLASASGIPGRRSAVLSHLRDRLFDLSRRNRLIYFKPTQSSVNLTEASVPIVMRLESVRSEQLCTWGGKFVGDILSGRSVPLNKWLRFEDQPHLPSAFDRIIQETRRDRAEFGFSNLRLVVGFLRWHNLKEAPDERIVSPLLWLPVEVSKTKGVRDQYVLRCPETVAEFNPALRHMLRQLYDIKLPETVDLAATSFAIGHMAIKDQRAKCAKKARADLDEPMRGPAFARIIIISPVAAFGDPDRSQTAILRQAKICIGVAHQDMILTSVPFVALIERREHGSAACFQIICEPLKIKFVLERADVLKADKRARGIGNGTSHAKYPSFSGLNCRQVSGFISPLASASAINSARISSVDLLRTTFAVISIAMPPRPSSRSFEQVYDMVTEM